MIVVLKGCGRMRNTQTTHIPEVIMLDTLRTWPVRLRLASMFLCCSLGSGLVPAAADNLRLLSDSRKHRGRELIRGV